MTDQEKQAQFYVPLVSALVDDLLTLTNHILIQRVDYDHGDPEQLMLLSFVTKQREHLNSVRLLTTHNYDGDAGLISRTMIEGMAQLLWAFQNRPSGPEDWYWFGLVMDWRQVTENEANGIKEPAEKKQLLTTNLAAQGPRYYTSKAEEKLSQGDPLPADPYRKQWHRLNVADIFTKVKGADMYDDVYRNLSERIHWNPREVFRSLEFDNGSSSTYKSSDARTALGALVYGFQSLHQCLELIGAHFSLDIQPELNGLFSKFQQTTNLTP